MNYSPTEYFSIHEDNWELDIPRIIANKSTMLWLGKGLLFKSENKDLLNFLNKLKDKDKWNEKLYQFGIQNSLLGKCFLMWMLTKNGELSLTLPSPSFMSRVAKFNEQEQSAELFFMNEQSDNGSLTWVTIENSKVKVEIFNGNREILLGSTKSKIKPESQLQKQYELKNPFGYLPIVEITNLPQIHFYGNSTQMNAYPDCAPVWNLIWDLQHIIKQKRKERILNLTRFYGIIDNEKFKALNLSDDFQSIIKDAFLNITTANYVKGGNGGVDIVQGNPKFGEYWLDYNGTAKQIFNGAGYDYDEFNGINYENKTKTLMNNKFDMQTTEVKITHYSTYLYRMFDMLVTSSKNENGKVYWNGKGERPYSFEFIPIAMVDQLVQDELINSRLNNGTLSVIEAISLYENIDTLMAKQKLENIINENKFLNKNLGDNTNDNEQRSKNSINETSTSSIKANSTINKEM